jgi:hypothetical protein
VRGETGQSVRAEVCSPDGLPLLRSALTEFRAYLVGVGMFQPAEDVQRLRPCLTGAVGVAGGLVDVTEVAEADGLVVGGPGFAEQGQRALVALDGLPVAAKVTVDVADAVVDVRLAVAVAEDLLDGESPLAVRECPRVIALLD